MSKHDFKSTYLGQKPSPLTWGLYRKRRKQTQELDSQNQADRSYLCSLLVGPGAPSWAVLGGPPSYSSVPPWVGLSYRGGGPSCLAAGHCPFGPCAWAELGGVVAVPCNHCKTQGREGGRTGDEYQGLYPKHRLITSLPHQSLRGINLLPSGSDE